MKTALASSLVAVALLGACASQNAVAVAGKAVKQTRAGMADAALTPLEDLNLRREAIPRVLTGLQNPYDVPDDISCAEIKQQLASLEEVLGPDWDVPSNTGADTTLTERAAEESSEKILEIIADEAASMIPYRSWVRRLSGAKDHEKKVKQAIERGEHRRTYLKALARSKDCDATVAPEHESARLSPRVEYKTATPPQYRPGKAASQASHDDAVKEAPLAELDNRLSLSERTSSPSTW